MNPITQCHPGPPDNTFCLKSAGIFPSAHTNFISYPSTKPHILLFSPSQLLSKPLPQCPRSSNRKSPFMPFLTASISLSNRLECSRTPQSSSSVTSLQYSSKILPTFHKPSFLEFFAYSYSTCYSTSNCSQQVKTLKSMTVRYSGPLTSLFSTLQGLGLNDSNLSKG